MSRGYQILHNHIKFNIRVIAIVFNFCLFPCPYIVLNNFTAVRLLKKHASNVFSPVQTRSEVAKRQLCTSGEAKRGGGVFG
jgi:uncharacterized protein YutD